MKKRISRILLIVLIVTLVGVLAACNPNSKDGDDGENTYEKPKYSVTYLTNGGADFSAYNRVKDVESGSYISAPKDESGNLREPVKKGYEFKGWSANGTDVFKFDTTPVTKDLTLTALYIAKTFKHTVSLYEDKDNAAYENYVVMPGSDLTSTFDAALSSNLACPSTSKMIADGKPDRFCYWYYYDKDGNKVRFSSWADVPESSTEAPENVTPMSRYSFNEPLELFAMWLSALPAVNVNFKDSMSELSYGTQTYKYKESIPKNSITATKPGYELTGWYYVVKDSDDKDVKKDFLFFDSENTDDEYLELDYSVTGAENEFTDASFTLYAKWTKKVTISNAETFEEYYNKVNEETSEEKLAELLSANIKITGDINFNGKTFKPLFSVDKPFVGRIEGNKHMFSNFTVEGTDNVALFGVMNGTLKELNLENVTLSILKTDNAYAKSVNASALVAVNGGRIDSCKVTLSSVKFSDVGSVAGGMLTNGIPKVVYGGIAARNSGTIEACQYLETGDGVFRAQEITYGGIAGVSSGLVTGCKATLKNLRFESCPDSASGASSLTVGMLVGRNYATVSNSSFEAEIVNAASPFSSSFGGAVGINDVGASMSRINGKLVSANLVVGSTNSKAAAIGGLAGRNEGVLRNCYVGAVISITLSSDNTVVYSGGVAGACFNSSSASSSETVGRIYACYSTGSLSVDAGAYKNAIIAAAGVSGRNYGNTVSSAFSLMNITVTHDITANGGATHIGFIAGLLENSPSISDESYYGSNKLVLNGTEYALDNEGNGNFEATAKGKNTDDANFKKATFVKSTLGFDEKIWRIESEGETLPTFII